jgi:hypothetical protein
MTEALDRLKVALSPASPTILFAAFGCLTVFGWSGVNAQRVGENELISFDTYHTVEELEAFLEAIVHQYDELADLVEIGHSRGRRRILAVEVNNPETGPAREKSAFYLDGNIHGGEVLAGEGALYFVNHLLTNYGHDAEITALVDTRAFYVVPLVNPGSGRQVADVRRRLAPDGATTSRRQRHHRHSL